MTETSSNFENETKHWYSDHRGHVSMELMKGEVADAVLEAILEMNQNVEVSDLPGFIVIEVPNRLELNAELVRDHLGKNDWTMTDLNEIMPAFAGQIEEYTEDKIVLSRIKK
jgi:hypothetical protein